MTTSVKVHVNGKYRATVVQKNADGKVVDTAVVEGNYEGSSNPSGEQTFHLHHPAQASFDITEEDASVLAPSPEPAPQPAPPAPTVTPLD